MRLSLLRLAAALLIVSGALGVLSSARAEPPSGSKNFSTPAAVPNYFSNESGPVMRSPAPFPAAPPAPTRAAPVEEESPSPAVAAVPTPLRAVVKPERRVITIVTSRSRGRIAHAKVRTADKRRVVSAARNRSSKPVRAVVRTERPRAARLAHAEPHAGKSKPVAPRGGHARGRG